MIQRASSHRWCLRDILRMNLQTGVLQPHRRGATNHVVSKSSSGFYSKLLPSLGQYLVKLNRSVERLENFCQNCERYVLEVSCKVGCPRNKGEARSPKQLGTPSHASVLG